MIVNPGSAEIALFGKLTLQTRDRARQRGNSLVSGDPVIRHSEQTPASELRLSRKGSRHDLRRFSVLPKLLASFATPNQPLTKHDSDAGYPPSEPLRVARVRPLTSTG